MKRIHRLFYPPAWSIAVKVSAALLAAALIPMSFDAYYNLQRGLKRAEEGEYRKLELLATSAASRLDQLIINVQHIVVQISTQKSAIAFLTATTVQEQKAAQADLQDALDKIKEEDIAKIVNGLNLAPESYAFLIDQIGVIISHPNKSLLYHSLVALSWKNQRQIKIDQRYHLEKIDSLNLNKLAKAMVGATESGHLSYQSPLEKERQMVGFAPLEVEPWVLGVNKPEIAFTAPLRHLIWQNSISLLIVGAIASCLAIVLAQSIAKPIRELTITAKAIKQGDFNHTRLTHFSDKQDDIGQLVRVFIHMAAQVEVREQKLKQQLVQLNFEIDEAKKERQVAAVTGTEYFQQLQQKAQRLRQRTPVSNHNKAEYYQLLQQKARQIRERNGE